MGHRMLHIVDIDADARVVYEAISTRDGLRSFWTADADAEPTVGSRARFGFPEAPVGLDMEITALEPGRLVAWHCHGDFPFWVGTTMDWRLSDSPLGSGTRVTFVHEGWPDDYPDAEFGLVNHVWGRIVDRLQRYAETGVADPVYPPSLAGAAGPA